MVAAACAAPEHEDLPWFPVRGQSPAPAVAVCETCTVREVCLDYAIAEDLDDGVWGGMSPAQRKQLRRARDA